MPQSARATFKLWVGRWGQSDIAVSMPQSARATFKPPMQPGHMALGVWFQCLNRHEQPSSLLPAPAAYEAPAVSMPQSARATFKRQLSPESKVAYMFQCLNRHEQPSSTMIASAVCVNSTFQCLNRHEQPSSRCVGGAEHARASFNASIGTSNL